MSDDNPYQSPQCYGPAEDPVPIAGAREGVWRLGKLLVLREGAVLPDRCMMSNAPAHGHRIGGVCVLIGGLLPGLLIEFGWLAMVPGLLIWHCLSIILSGSVIVDLPIRPERHGRRRMMMGVSRVLVVTAGVVLIVGFLMGESHFAPGWLMAFGGLTVVLSTTFFLSGVVLEWCAPGIPTVLQIKEGHVWLKGVHPAFLAELPEWPEL